ncbi:leucine-rich melanocyte differentiation-associated protein-like [Planococcus citri]|uniref:leucine-rich melanocyte differentiation-associated protein-like n=1 Tax=Planococcus citri TaxID=170843 RepID=UPI0031F7ABA8
MEDNRNGTSTIARGSYKIENGRLSYIGHDITRIPDVFGKLHGSEITTLDLSFNNIMNLSSLERFPALTHLILDNNQLSDSIMFQPIQTLETLSLNNNKITDLDGLVQKLRKNFPILRHLSLLGNKACPNQISDSQKDEDDYKRYRCFVLHYLRTLRFLDFSPVSVQELREAAIKGQFMLIKRPKEIPEVDDFYEQDSCRYTPLPESDQKVGEHKGAYGMFKFRYTTKQSEGNRFIVNNDL